MRISGFWYLALAGCGPAAAVAPAPRAPEPAPAPAPIAAEPSPAPGLPKLEAGDLVVGSERGIEIVGADGKLKRLVSAGPALHPRWLDAGSVLVLVPAQQGTLSGGGRLERVALADGQRSELATLPRFGCNASELEQGPSVNSLGAVNLQDETDFEVDVGQQLVCLRLMDRNINMVDVMLDVRIDLANHKLERWLAMGEQCQAPPDVHAGNAPSTCQTTSAPEPDAGAGNFAFDVREDGEQIDERTPQGVKLALRIPGYSGESLSPSGRWRVLGGDQEDGDYIHRALVLLDRSNGQVYPVPPEGDWPEPLAVSGKPRRIKTPIERAAQVVGETDVRWLGSGDSELLIVDDVAVRPGVGGFALRGRVAM
jgi:hypothetical protein